MQFEDTMVTKKTISLFNLCEADSEIFEQYDNKKRIETFKFFELQFKEKDESILNEIVRNTSLFLYQLRLENPITLQNHFQEMNEQAILLKQFFEMLKGKYPSCPTEIIIRFEGKKNKNKKNKEITNEKIKITNLALLQEIWFSVSDSERLKLYMENTSINKKDSTPKYFNYERDNYIFVLFQYLYNSRKKLNSEKRKVESKEGIYTTIESFFKEVFSIEVGVKIIVQREEEKKVAYKTEMIKRAFSGFDSYDSIKNTIV